MEVVVVLRLFGVDGEEELVAEEVLRFQIVGDAQGGSLRREPLAAGAHEPLDKGGEGAYM